MHSSIGDGKLIASIRGAVIATSDADVAMMNWVVMTVFGEADFVGPWNHGNGLIPVQSEIKGGNGLDVTPYDPQPGSQQPSPIDSTPVGQFTNGVGEKQAAIHERARLMAEKDATIEV